MFGFLFKPVALVSALALSTVGVLSRKYQKVKLYYHLGLYLSALGALSVWGVFISIVASVAGQRLNINYLVARSFYLTCSPLIGIKLIVEGEEHLSSLATDRGGKGQSAVLCGNHQSLLDILFLGRIFPKRAAIMAKKELKWAPLLGQYLALSGAVFVDRKNRKAAVQALEQAGDDMKKRGVSLWVFPEGTRSSLPEPTLLPFKKGAFHLAVQAQVPIVPIVCENYHRLFDGKTRMEEGVLRVRVLPPISTEGLGPDDVTALSEKTREQMLEALVDISAPGPSQSQTPSSSKPTPAVPQQDETRKPQALHVDISKGQTSDGIRRRANNGSDGSSSSADSPVDSAGKSSEAGKSESTEDEMDGDAVLLSRP